MEGSGWIAVWLGSTSNTWEDAGDMVRLHWLHAEQELGRSIERGARHEEEKSGSSTVFVWDFFVISDVLDAVKVVYL